MSDRKAKINRIAISGVLAALIFVMTFIIKIPIPATGGYINLGDSAIIISSFILGPFAAIPAAIGSAMCDLVSGYPHYIRPTFVIKGLMGLAAGAVIKRRKSLPARIIAGLAAEIIMVGGYFLFEALPVMYGVEAALSSVPFNAIQGACAIIIAIPLSYVRLINKSGIIRD